MLLVKAITPKTNQGVEIMKRPYETFTTREGDQFFAEATFNDETWCYGSLRATEAEAIADLEEVIAAQDEAQALADFQIQASGKLFL